MQCALCSEMCSGVQCAVQGWLFCIYVCEAAAANSTWAVAHCGKTISTADAAEMAGRLVIFGHFGRLLVLFGCFWLIFGHFWSVAQRRKYKYRIQQQALPPVPPSCHPGEPLLQQVGLTDEPREPPGPRSPSLRPPPPPRPPPQSAPRAPRIRLDKVLQ